jgi:hypothetical protein
MMAKTLSSKVWDGHYGDRDVEAGGMLERRGDGEVPMKKNGEEGCGVYPLPAARRSDLHSRPSTA